MVGGSITARLRAVRTPLLFALGYALVAFLRWNVLYAFIHTWIHPELLRWVLRNLCHIASLGLATFLLPALLASGIAFVLRRTLSPGSRSYLARMVEAVRTRTWPAALPALTCFAFCVMNAPTYVGTMPAQYYMLFGVWLAQAFAVYASARFAMARFMDMRPEEGYAPPERADDMVFAAVAVTPTTRGLVALMAALPFLFGTYMVNAPHVGDLGAFLAVLGYATVALGGATRDERAPR